MFHESKHSIVTHKILNEKTGELEAKDFEEIKTSKKIKGGFNMIYHKPYEEAMEVCVKSNKELKLFNWVTNQFTYTRVEVPIIYTLAKKDGIEISKRQFSNMLKILVDINYLQRVSRGVYRLNPFVYLPFRANAEELQQEWNDMFDGKNHLEPLPTSRSKPKHKPKPKHPTKLLYEYIDYMGNSYQFDLTDTSIDKFEIDVPDSDGNYYVTREEVIEVGERIK